MRSWKDFIIYSTMTIKDAMGKINDLGGKGLYVVDDNQRLIGSVTDGDIRRALIKGVGLAEEIRHAMKADARFVNQGISDLKKLEMLEKNRIQSVPVIDANNVIVDIFTIEQLKDHSEIQVVLLAGGMGTRLGKITENLPKPMVKVAGEPILERILRRLLIQGFSQFNISVNYKAEIIEDYFKDGKHLGCEISYLKESKRLGTAGPLSLLKNNGKPVIVMNGDLLTHVNIGQLLNYHLNHEAKVTMCTRDHEIQIPFGVINIQDGYAQSFHEKPTYNFNVNAGIYVIEPEVIKMIPKDEYYDMSSLLNTLLEKGKNEIACFPIVEGWIDVGRESDLMLAQEVYSKSEE